MSPRRMASPAEAAQVSANQARSPERSRQPSHQDGTGLAGQGRAGSLLGLQRSHGNHFVQRLLGGSQTATPPPVIQRSLRVGTEGGHLEHEAGRLAGEIADGEDPQAGARVRISRAGRGAGGVLDPVVRRILAEASGSGVPLPGSTRRTYERSLGADFGAVRVHTGPRANDINLRLRSSAATTGHDIFFRAGEYDPGSEAGQELLAHELVHVVQQSAEAEPGLIQLGRSKDRNTRRRPPARRSTTKRKRTTGRRGTGGSDDDSWEPDSRSEEDSDFEYDIGDAVEESGDEWQPRSSVRKSARSKSRKSRKTTTKSKPRAQSQPKVSKRKRDDDSEEAEAADRAQAPAGEELDVKYFTMDEMKEYLIGQELPVDKEPEPVSVGVVVWNINHLKAEEEEKKTERKATARKGKKARTAEPEPEGYDEKAILAAMETLKNELAKVGDNLTIAADLAISELGDPPENKKQKTQYSGTKRELSQLKTDIKQIRERDLGPVLKAATAAIAGHEQDAGKGTIEERAERLDQIRGLARVLKRLDRLNTVLFAGKSTIEMKTAARGTVRAVLAKQAEDSANLSAAITALRDLLPSKGIEAATSAIKRTAVVDLSTGTFFQNPAVNLVLINEMNLGIKALAAATAATDDRLNLSTGPIMLARAEKRPEGATGKAAITVGAGDDAQQVVGRQYEYYPAINRTGGEQGLTALGTFYVSTAGLFAVQGEHGANSAIGWNKSAKSFRGIVVHRYRQGAQEFWAGILHTTPAGKDLDRAKIWPQIRAPLASLNELALHFKIPLLVGGDFYIPAEGIVNNPTTEQNKEIKDADPELMTTVKLWNFARNVFLSAQAEMTPGDMDAFADTVSKTELPQKEDKPAQIPAKAKKKTTKKVAAKKAAAKKTAAKKVKKGAPRKSGKQATEPAKVLRFNAGISKKENKRQWDVYSAAARTAIGKLPKSAFRRDLAMAMLAPGKKYDVNWDWTLGAGDIKQVDIIRNYRRPAGSALPHPEPLITMRRALKPLGYKVIRAGSPTNPKDTGRGENKMQIADLFLVNKYWKTTRSGLVTPGKAELKPMDDSALSATRTYWKISDHSPVLLLGSTTEHDVFPHRAFQMPAKAAKQAVKANMKAMNYYEEMFGGLQTLPEVAGIKEQIAEIKGLLTQPLTSPHPDLLAEITDLTNFLVLSIAEIPDFVPTAKQRAALNGLAHWQPYYTTDFAVEVKRQGDVQQESESESDEEEGFAQETEAAYDDDDDLLADLLDPDALTDADWPTGEIAHASNSCYLAALIHVLASHYSLSSLADPGILREAGPSVEASKFQVDSGLHQLITKLNNPKDTITTDEMRTFMRYLDSLGDMLSPEPLTEPEKKQLGEQASNAAKQATAKRKAYGVQQDAAEILLKVLNRLDATADVVAPIQSTITPPTSADPPNVEGQSVLLLPVHSEAITSIHEALASYSQPEDIEAGYDDVPRQRALQFARLPDVLTISLSRFQWNGDGSRRKIKRSIRADDPLTIPEQCLTPALRAEVGDTPVMYRLIHMVHHQGETMRGGHYRSFGRIPGDGQAGQWYRHDDTNYPFRRIVPGNAALKKALKTGYIYVYQRIP